MFLINVINASYMDALRFLQTVGNIQQWIYHAMLRKKEKNMRLHLPKLSYVENRLKKHATLMSLFLPTMLHKITGVK